MSVGRIENYGELKAAVKLYTGDREDLHNMIPAWITLASRWIFRGLRVPTNETLFDYEPPSDDTGYDLLEIPGDFLELKFLLCNDAPMERVSDLKIRHLQAVRKARSRPTRFARIGNRFYLHPYPDGVYTHSMVYWADYTNTLQNDQDTHDVLRIAPDLFLYGALLQAEPYYINDDRLATWRVMYESALAQLNGQKDEAEYSGSNVAVAAVGGD